jgi:hypothetical protein
MAWASRSGRARVSSSHPEAFGVCQRCGIWYNRNRLQNQMEWRGVALLPTWLFVCERCYDKPQEQNRVFVPPADPVPIQLALPEDFTAAETTVMGLAAPPAVDPHTGLPLPPTTAMQTTDGVLMSPTPTGRPPGYALEAVMPLAMTNGVPTEYDVPLPVTSMLANGTPLVTVACSGPHGLALNGQVAVRGSASPLADGMFSVIPITATVFTYGCYSPIPAGPLLQPGTIVVTAQVGLPRSYPALPQTGLTASQTPPTSTSQ